MKSLHTFLDHDIEKIDEGILNKVVKFKTKTSSKRAFTMQKQADKYIKQKLGKDIALDVLDLVDNNGYLYWLVRVKVEGKIIEGYVADKFVDITPQMSFFRKEFMYKQKQNRDHQNSKEEYDIEMKNRHIQKGKDMLTNIKSRFAKDQEKVQARKVKKEEREEKRDDRTERREEKEKSRFFKRN